MLLAVVQVDFDTGAATKILLVRAVRVKIEQVCAFLKEITIFCQDDQ